MIRIKQEPIDISEDDPPTPLKQEVELDENTIDSSFSRMNSRFRDFVQTVKELSDRMNQMDNLLSQESILECKRLLHDFQEILDKQIVETRDELNASTYEFEGCLIDALKRPRAGPSGESLRGEKRRRITLSSDDLSNRIIPPSLSGESREASLHVGGGESRTVGGESCPLPQVPAPQEPTDDFLQPGPRFVDHWNAKEPNASSYVPGTENTISTGQQPPPPLKQLSIPFESGFENKVSSYAALAERPTGVAHEPPPPLKQLSIPFESGFDNKVSSYAALAERPTGVAHETHQEIVHKEYATRILPLDNRRQSFQRDHSLPGSSDRDAGTSITTYNTTLHRGEKARRRSLGSTERDKPGTEEAVTTTLNHPRRNHSPPSSARGSIVRPPGPRFPIKHSCGRTREELDRILVSEDYSELKFGLARFGRGSSMFPRKSKERIKQIVLPAYACDHFITSREENQTIYVFGHGQTSCGIGRHLMLLRLPIALFLDPEDENERIYYVGHFKVVESSETIFAPRDKMQQNGRAVCMSIDLKFSFYNENLHGAIKARGKN